MNTTGQGRALISITCATLLWGTTYPVIKFGLAELNIPPISYLTLRFSAALFALLPLLFIGRVRKEFIWSLPRIPILILGTLNGIAYTLQFSGQMFTSSGVATIMVNTYVLFTLLFGRMVLGKRITIQKKLAVLLGFIGVVVIALGDLIHLEEGSTSPLGVVLTLGTGFCAGLYVTYSEKVYELSYNGSPLSPVSIFFSSTVYTLLVIVLSGFILHDLPRFSSLHLIDSIPILYLGILCTSSAFILYLIAVRDVGAVNTAVFMLLQIIVSIGFSFVLLKEIPDRYMAIGAPLIFIAIYLTREVREKKGFESSSP